MIKPGTGPANRQVFSRLRRTDTALAGKQKNQPVIVFRHGRWHMLLLGYVADADHEAQEGIATVHFLSDYRARKMIKEQFPYCQLVPFEAVYPGFEKELAAKVLPDAESYRPLLEAGCVTLAGGYTSDTLRSAPAGMEEDRLVATITGWMAGKEMGPFLRFERNWEVVKGAVEQRSTHPPAGRFDQTQ